MHINYLIIQLITVHFIVDYVLQPKNWVDDKKNKKWKSPFLYIHALLHGLLSWLVLFDVYAWWLGLIVAITHLTIDRWKVSKKKETSVLFVADQSLHILVLVGCWIIYSDKYSEISLLLEQYFVSKNTWLTICGLIVLFKPTSIFINVFVDKWSISSTGLKDAGKYIGYLERILTFVFILSGMYEAIGFLVAAKSILRLGNGNSRDRSETEYVLIGTFLSFFIATIIALVVKYATF